jgi:hypothetical protein
MKHTCFFAGVCLFVLAVTGMSPAGPDYYYGGTIVYHNASSHNLYLELAAFHYDTRLCLDRDDKIARDFGEYSYTPIASPPGNPNGAPGTIIFYDMDTGVRLKTEAIAAFTFDHTSGSLANNNAVFTFTITDTVLQ